LAVSVIARHDTDLFELPQQSRTKVIKDIPADLHERLRQAVSAFDAASLATAEAPGPPLVTEDGRLIRVAPEIARFLGSFTSDP
jgi:predicted nucleic acid-binding protein